MTPRSARSVVLHGHFYQPPRDDPWLETVRREPSAAPAHDWNERIDRECYRAVTAARTQDARGLILSITNTLEWISFNVGPTLLEWMERHAPTTYRDVLEADARARMRTGWGTALAQPYHHAILPLASPRDRKTEIRWGIADFRRRFGRDPLGMWLPETAVDLDTLDDLAAEGIAFTIVGDHQVETPPTGGRPGWVTTPGGRRIAVFCYDGPLSHGVAFGNLLRDAGAWARALLKGVGVEDAAQGATLTHGPTYGGAGAPAPHPHHEVVLLATDGETFGHHHPFGDMALASLLERLRKHPTVRVEPLAAVLERFPPREELVLRSPSAWSCAHGVERWRSDCGCRTSADTQQGWRAPLRQGLDALAAGLHRVYESEARAAGVDDPWALRDALGPVVGAGPGVWRERVDELFPVELSSEGRIRIRALLEMERDVLRSFTSCGWFFDDIGGLEGLQVLRYAARAVELAGPDHGEALETELLTHLGHAVSNDPALGTGADLYRRDVLPHPPPEVRVAAGAAALAALVPHGTLTPGLNSWDAQVDSRPDGEEGGWRIRVTHRRTGLSQVVPLELERPDPGRLVLRVPLAPGSPPLELQADDLPESQGAPVASALRADLIRRWLSAADRDRLLAGETTVDRLVVDRLTAELGALEGSPPSRVADRVGLLQALAAMARLAEEGIPFDVQTRFHHVGRTLDDEAREHLAPLAELLGFAPAAAPTSEPAPFPAGASAS